MQQYGIHENNNILTQLEKYNIENVTHSCYTLLPTLPVPQSKWVPSPMDS